MEPQSGGGSDFFLEQKKTDSCLQSLSSVLIIFTFINQANPAFLESRSHDLNPLLLFPGEDLQEKSSD